MTVPGLLHFRSLVGRATLVAQVVALVLLLGACSDGGQTGGYAPPDQCQTKASSSTPIDTDVPDVGATPLELAAPAFGSFVTDVAVLAYPVGPGVNSLRSDWSDIELESVSCDAGTLTIEPVGAVATFVLRSEVSEGCAHFVQMPVQVHLELPTLEAILPADLQWTNDGTIISLSLSGTVSSEQVLGQPPELPPPDDKPLQGYDPLNPQAELWLSLIFEPNGPSGPISWTIVNHPNGQVSVGYLLDAATVGGCK